MNINLVGVLGFIVQACMGVYLLQFTSRLTNSQTNNLSKLDVTSLMTSETRSSSRPHISPVPQFALLLSPVVMTCFYLVYAMTGWVIDGRDKFNWSIEAVRVASWVGSGIVLYSVLVLLYVYYKGVGRKHILVYSSVLHIVFAVLLTVSIFVCVRV